jgi:hypothetical protein
MKIPSSAASVLLWGSCFAVCAANFLPPPNNLALQAPFLMICMFMNGLYASKSGMVEIADD